MTEQHVTDLVQHDVVAVERAGGFLVEDVIRLVGGKPHSTRGFRGSDAGRAVKVKRPSTLFG